MTLKRIDFLHLHSGHVELLVVEHVAAVYEGVVPDGRLDERVGRSEGVGLHEGVWVRVIVLLVIPSFVEADVGDEVCTGKHAPPQRLAVVLCGHVAALAAHRDGVLVDPEVLVVHEAHPLARDVALIKSAFQLLRVDVLAPLLGPSLQLPCCGHRLRDVRVGVLPSVGAGHGAGRREPTADRVVAVGRGVPVRQHVGTEDHHGVRLHRDLHSARVLIEWLKLQLAIVGSEEVDQHELGLVEGAQPLRTHLLRELGGIKFLAASSYHQGWGPCHWHVRVQAIYEPNTVLRD
mmetsp:Transcript_35881/g.81071  ORF Transcript_35881/g.81071 Transcript_35881/m.81071 type:complete len:290 (-) Transcript_35881:92-961(-)